MAERVQVIQGVENLKVGVVSLGVWTRNFKPGLGQQACLSGAMYSEQTLSKRRRDRDSNLGKARWILLTIQYFVGTIDERPKMNRGKKGDRGSLSINKAILLKSIPYNFCVQCTSTEK